MISTDRRRMTVTRRSPSLLAIVLYASLGCSSVADEAVPEQRGSVYAFTHTSPFKPGTTTQLDATFRRLVRRDCEAEVIGECNVEHCVGNRFLTMRAGTVDIGVGPTATRRLMLPGNSEGTDVLASGDTLVFRHVGGDAPSFETNVRQPQPLVLDRPAPQRDTLEIDGPDDVVLHFSGAEVGARLLLEFEDAPPPNETTVSCNFDASSGSVTLPTNALRATGVHYGRFFTAIESRVTVRDWQIHVAARTDVYVQTKTPDAAGLSVTLR